MVKINKLVNIEAVFSAFNPSFGEDFCSVGERHNFWELVYVVKGTLSVSEEEKIYELKAGEIIFFKPMEFHHIRATDGEAPELIIMNFSAIGTGFDTISNGVFTLNSNMFAALKEALESAAYCMDFDDAITNQLIASNLEKLILMVIKEQGSEPKQEKTIGAQNYREIIKTIGENIEKNLSISEISALCGLGESNLKKTFKKFAGIGVMEYCNSLKITKAMSMIINDNMSIAQISEKLGYSSQNYFSMVFKKKCGMTPTEYKSKFVTDIRSYP